MERYSLFLMDAARASEDRFLPPFVLVGYLKFWVVFRNNISPEKKYDFKFLGGAITKFLVVLRIMRYRRCYPFAGPYACKACICTAFR